MKHDIPGKTEFWSRRKLLKLGLVGAGMTSAVLTLRGLKAARRPTVNVPPLPSDALAEAGGMNAMTMLRDFDYGTVK